MAVRKKRKAKTLPTVVAPVTVVAPKPSNVVTPLQIIDGGDWINSRWRPWMAMQYLIVCLCDFIFFPLLQSVYRAIWNLPVLVWEPNTLKGGGLYHVAMGAIITATAYGRSQEKIAAIKSDMPGSSAAGGSTSVGG